MKTNTRGTLTLLLALIAALPALAADRQTKKPPKKLPPLATVNGEVVTVEEFQAEFVRLHGGHKKFLAGASEISAFLEIVLDRRLLLQEAYQLGLDELPAIKEAVEAKAVDKGTAWVKAQAAVEVEPSAEEVRQAWERNTGLIFRALQIVVPTREEANEIFALLDAGVDFQELARECSVGATRLQGGMLSSVGWGSADPVWEETVFQLAPGQTSQPFKSEEGWEVVRMLSHAYVEPPPFDRARGRVEGILKRRASEKRRKEHDAALEARYHVLRKDAELDPTALPRLLASSPGLVLATWDGGSLTLGSLATGRDLAAFARMPGSQARKHLKELVDRTVQDALVLLEAQRLKVRERPEIAFELRTYQESLMERALYADYVLKGIKVNEADIKAHYDAHQEELKSPERRHTSHLVVKDEKLAAELRARALAGEKFADLVKQHSTDVQTKDKGGDLGWITAKEVPPEFRQVLDLPLGGVSEPVASTYGFHLIKVNLIEAPKALPFEAVHDEIGEKLVEQAKTERRAEWVKKLRDVADIRIDPKAIEALAASTEL